MAEDDPLAYRKRLRLSELLDKRWIMVDRRAYPAVYQSLFDHARASNSEPRGLHHVMSAEEGGRLITKGGGISSLTKAGTLRVAQNGPITRELDEQDLCLYVHLAARADENLSWLASSSEHM